MRLCVSQWLAILVLILVSAGTHAAGWRISRETGESGGPNKLRTLAYPYGKGVPLGNGWNSIIGEKTSTTCITFSPAADDYQELAADVEEAIDEETLSILLNLSMRAEAKAKIGGFGGSAEASTDISTFMKFTSKDTVFVARASVINGAKYVAPTGAGNLTLRPNGKLGNSFNVTGGRIDLLPGLADLAENYPELFRQICGDGFVSSIASGAEAYVVYTFRTRSNEEKVKIRTSAKASGGFSFLSGSASSEFKAEIERFQKEDRLRIEFRQRGGGGAQASIPVDRATVADAISKLPGQAKDMGRPLYMVLQSYETLPSWPKKSINPTLSVQERLARYYTRLTSVVLEIEDIKNDWSRDFTKAGDFGYLFAGTHHRLRTEDFRRVQDEVLAELTSVADDLQVATNDPTCSSNEKSKIDACSAKLKTKEVDELRFLIQLPVPLSAIPKEFLDVIMDVTKQEDERAYLLSKWIHRHVVQRRMAARCELAGECTSNSTILGFRAKIEATFPSLQKKAGDLDARFAKLPSIQKFGLQY